MTWDEALKSLTAKGQPYELIPVEAMGQTARVFANAPATLRDLYEAARSPLAFVTYEDEHLSFEDVWRRSGRLAAALVRSYGVAKGDRVAISMRNYPEWIIAFNAATSIGAVAVAMNALWQPDEIAFALGDCRPKVLLADQERLERLAACGVPARLQVIAVRANEALPIEARRYEDVLSAYVDEAMPYPELSPDDDAIMLYTSGSTGHPKGAVSTHRNIISALLSWELDAEAAILTGNAPAPDPDAPQPAALLAIPLFHVSGLHFNLLASYRRQRRIICMHKWDPQAAVEIIAREQVTLFNGPSAVTGDLIRAARRLGADLASLTVVGGGGASRAPEQVRAIDETFINAAPNTGWGMTETNAIGTGVSGPDYLSHPASSGRVSAVLDIRIVDEDGQVLPAASRGELQIRGASVMRGYWERPEANAETFVDGWLRTGDVAYVDADGFVHIVDRIKDLVIRGGENIGCGAVEAALLEHPDVLEASVYGVPDERLGEEVGATVYARRAIDEGELRAFVGSRLAKFAVPRYLHVSATPLPRIASGKILKRQLREEAVRRLREPVADGVS